MTTRHVPDAIHAFILANPDMTSQEIAERFGITRRTVQSYRTIMIAEGEIKSRGFSVPLSPFDTETAWKMRESGATHRQIAEALGRHHATIAYFLKAEERRRGRTAKPAHHRVCSRDARAFILVHPTMPGPEIAAALGIAQGTAESYRHILIQEGAILPLRTRAAPKPPPPDTPQIADPPPLPPPGTFGPSGIVAEIIIRKYNEILSLPWYE